MEKRVRDSALKDGLGIDVRWNKANNYRFTEITAGQWTFTLKHTSDERYMLKGSSFREQNAQLNYMLPQLVMPSIIGQEKKPSTSQFSAIIFHATDQGDSKTPGFIRIGVPKEDFSWWEVCFDIHELMAETAAPESPEEIKAVATWKNRAARNSNQGQ